MTGDGEQWEGRAAEGAKSLAVEVDARGMISGELEVLKVSEGRKEDAAGDSGA